MKQILDIFRNKTSFLKSLLVVFILSGGQAILKGQEIYEINLEWKIADQSCGDRSRMEFSCFISSTSGDVELNDIDVRFIYDNDLFINSTPIFPISGYFIQEISEAQASAAAGIEFFDFEGAPVFVHQSFLPLGAERLTITSTPTRIFNILLDFQTQPDLDEIVCAAVLFDQVDNTIDALSFDGVSEGIEVSIGGLTDEAFEIVDHFGWDYGLGDGVFGGLDLTETCILFCNALPVQWHSFDVHKKMENGVLHWATVTEFNNNYFEIQRSNDGLNFAAIEIMEGAGNSAELLQYEFIDRDPKKGYNYYRIMQVDHDGTSNYTEIKSVHFDAGNADNIELFPNPVRDRLMLHYGDSNWKGPIIVEIYSTNGKLLERFHYEQSVYSERIEIDIADLENGMYMLKTYNNQHTKSIPFVHIAR